MYKFEEIEELIEQQKYEESKNKILQALISLPDDLFLLNSLAICQIFLLEYKEALETLNNIINKHPNDDVALYNIAYLDNKLAMAEYLFQCIELLTMQHENVFKLYYVTEINLLKDALELDNKDDFYLFILAFFDLLSKNYAEFNQVYTYLTSCNSKYSNILEKINTNIDLLNYNIIDDSNFKDITKIPYPHAVEERVYHLDMYSKLFYQNKNYEMSLKTLDEQLKLNFYHSKYSRVAIFKSYLLKALIFYHYDNYKEFFSNIYKGILMHPLFVNINLTGNDDIIDNLFKNKYSKIITFTNGKKSPQMLNKLGISNAIYGNVEKALNIFDEAISIDYNYIPPYKNKIKLFHLLSEHQNIIDLIDKNIFLLNDEIIQKFYKFSKITIDKNFTTVPKENTTNNYYKFLISLQNSGTHYLKTIIQIILKNTSYIGRVFNEIANATIDKLKQIIKLNGKEILYYDHILFSRASELLLTEEFRNILQYRHPYETIISEIRYKIKSENISGSFDDVLRNYFNNFDKIFWRNHFLEQVYNWYKYNKILKIKYENLISSPKMHIISISNFYNLEFNEEKINTAAVISNIYLKNENEIELFPNPVISGRGNLNGEWKTLLLTDEIKMLQDVIGDIVSELGYDTE